MDLILSVGVLPSCAGVSLRALYDFGIRGPSVEMQQAHVFIHILLT